MATLEDLKQLFAGRKPHNVALEISAFTAFRTTLLEELTPEEINTLYRIHAPRTVDEEYNALKEELITKEWRSKILAAAEKAGIKEPGSFEKFNAWMQKRSIYRKQLTAYSLDELRDLNKQLHALQNNNARFANHSMTQAWWKKGVENKNWN